MRYLQAQDSREHGEPNEAEEKGAPLRESLRFAGALVDEGYSILIFPEGRLTRDGEIETFKGGVGLLAVELGISVVPIHLDGLYKVMSMYDRRPKEDFGEVTKKIEEAVRDLGRA